MAPSRKKATSRNRPGGRASITTAISGTDTLGIAGLIARRALPPVMTVTGLLLAGVGHAATINVTDGAVDDDPNNGNCSLVEAVRAANDNQPVDACAAGDGADTIILQGRGVFIFSESNDNTEGANALPSITSDITIRTEFGLGSGANTTIARDASPGTPSFRFFHVGGGGVLRLTGINLRNGRASAAGAGAHGGAIFVDSQGRISLAQSAVSGSSATGNGGALYNRFGRFTLEQSTLSGNSAGNGGGAVFNTSMPLVADPTVPHAFIRHSTISGNTAATGGGILNNDGTILIQLCTVTRNAAASGAGVFTFAEGSTLTQVVNSLVSGNSGDDVEFGSGSTNPFTSYGGNVVGYGNASGAFTNDYDVSGVPGPLLGPLADNGGWTQTHLPEPGSPAVDNGYIDFSPLPLGVDQRGQVIGLDGDLDGDARGDAGAVERNHPIRVDAGAVAPNPADGLCSLVEAIDNANSDDHPHTDCTEGVRSRGFDNIELPPGSRFTFSNAYGGTGPFGANALPVIESAIIIDGNGATVERSSEPGTPAFRLIASVMGDITLKEMTLRNGDVATDDGTDGTANGGALFIAAFSSARVHSSTLEGNAANNGGAIFDAGELEVHRSTLSGNTAQGAGGAIHSNSRDALRILSSTLSGNTASGKGGGVYRSEGIYGEPLRIVNSTITDNSAPEGMGAGLSGAPYDDVFTGVVAGSIIAGNLGSDVDVEGAPGNSILSLGANVIGTGNAANAFSAARDITGIGNPRLLPLADNGGPTRTHLPEDISQAVDRGTADCFALDEDQRRVRRPQDGNPISAGTGCDAGAVELGQPILVDAGAVAVNPDGVCSLPEAINNANDTDTGQPHPECAAGSPNGPDTVQLPDGSAFTFNAANPAHAADGPNALPSITSEVTIEGLGSSNVVIQRNEASPDAFRLLHVAPSGDLVVDNLSLSNGIAYTAPTGSNRWGGAILNNAGRLEVRDSTLHNNFARQLGGAICNCNEGWLSVSGSTLRNNFSNEEGGAIWTNTGDLSEPPATIINSTISDNSAAVRGGGIENYRGELVVSHSTITGNSAPDTRGSGIAAPAGTGARRVKLRASIVAGNENSDVDTFNGNGAEFVSLGGNVIGNGNAAGRFTQPDDSSSVTDPLLGALADNDGPTQTHLPRIGSPALDAVTTGCPPPEQDQRGVSRPQYGGIADVCDAGAVEVVIAGPIAVTDGVVVPTLGDNQCSLVEAIQNANDILNDGQANIDCTPGNVGSPDTIVLPENSSFIFSSVNNNTEGPNALPSITTALTIEGNGATIARSTMDAPTFRLFHVGPSGDLRLNQVTVQGGRVSGSTEDGGGIRVNEGNLHLTSSTVSGNSAAHQGGGIYARGGTTTLTNSTVSGNAAENGGGIFHQSGFTAFANSTVSDNSADFGGGLFRNIGTTTLTNSLIAGNSASTGAEIYNNQGAFSTTGRNLFGHDGLTNTQAFRYFAPDASNITATSNGNDATPLGSILGSLANNGGPTRTHGLPTTSPAVDAILGCNLATLVDQRGISRPQDGDGVDGPACDIGAVETTPIEAIVVDEACSLVEAIGNANDTGNGQPNADCLRGDAGGPDTIVLPADQTLTFLVAHSSDEGGNALPLINSIITIEGNGATIERGSTAAESFRIFHIDATGDLRLNNLTVQGGRTDDAGGGIRVDEGILQVHNGTVSGNSAGSGGGISNNGGSITLTSSTVFANTAGFNGGGINNFQGSTALTNSTVSGNAANSANSKGGGIYSSGGAETILSSTTVSGNTASSDGGGLFSTSLAPTITTTTLTNSLIAGNAAPYYAEVGNGFDSIFITNGVNLFGHAGLTYSQAFTGLPDGTHIFATSDSADTTPLGNILTPLARNDGLTRTHGLPPISPAVDAVGCDFAPATDQRDIPRPQDGDNDDDALCDIGAVETRDGDGDGIPDGFEIDNNLRLDVNDANVDDDLDGLTNLEELYAGTFAFNPDSDGDGIGDALDAAPLENYNACIGEDAAFEIVAPANEITQCAAGNSINFTADADVRTPNATVELIAPTITFSFGAGFPVGATLKVKVQDPAPGPVLQ